MTRTLLLGLLAALLCASPAGAVEIKQQTYRVDVRSPDELGEAVQIDTNAWVPVGAAPAGGWPLVLFFHGGGGNKDSEYDALRAKAFAEQGAVTVLYSARGHGASGGQVTVVGPKEIADLFDVVNDALTRHAPVDRDKVSLWGISQGGLHTNLGQVWSGDPAINPYGIRFISLQPGNTPDRTFEALVDREMVKLSFGLALVALYQTSTQGKVSPIVEKWIATTAADVPALYGGDTCDMTGHDEPASTMKSDLAARSFGCRLGDWTPPVQWSQAFDDTLFPADMATRSLRAHAGAADRLYLSSGGHGAPGSDPGIESDRLAHQLAWLAHVRDGAPLDQPRVVYWLRDPDVRVEHGARQYPPGAWVRRTAQAWPPAGTEARAFPLGEGDVPLVAGETDPANDPSVTTVAQSIPNGTTITGARPAAPAPGTVADFRTPPFAADAELVGAPAVKLRWTPASPDTQLVLRVFDEAPDGTLTLLTRGALGIRGAVPGETREVEVAAYEFGALLRAGHRVLARVSAGDSSYYKVYPGMAGGLLGLGPGAALTLPTKAATFAVRTGGCVDRARPATPTMKLRGRRGRLTASGRARDRGCSRLAAWRSRSAAGRGRSCAGPPAGATPRACRVAAACASACAPSTPRATRAPSGDAPQDCPSADVHVSMRRLPLLAALAAALILPASASAVVNGTAPTRDYPFMAALEDGDVQVCGASLVAPEWILTAAHCVVDSQASDLTFQIGGVEYVGSLVDLYSQNDMGERIAATEIVVHPDYGKPEFDSNDVALVKLARPSTYPPIALADPATQKALWAAGQEATVIGYGGPFYQTPSVLGELQEARIPMVSDEECASVYNGIQGVAAGYVEATTMVCAGNLHGTEDSCQGDSGGPLVVEQPGGGLVQVGVVSWGFACGLPTYYGVYARVGDTALNGWVAGTVGAAAPTTLSGKRKLL